MGDHPKSPQSNFYGILGIQKTASLSDICKAYKSLVMKWHPDRNPTNKAEAQAKFSSINEAYRALSIKKREEANTCNGGDHHHDPKTPKKKNKSSDFDKERHVDNGEEWHISKPILISRTTSRTSPVPSPTLSSSSSRRTASFSPLDFYSSFPTTPTGGNTPTTPTTPIEPASLSKVGSRRSTTPIFFSQSAARRKPQPIEKKLECTLEELCLGCVKKIKITRDAISSSGYEFFA